MDDEVTRLRAQLAEEQARREEAQRGQREEQRRREEEQRRRQNAERAAVDAIPQDLVAFLECCHMFTKDIKPVTDLSSATGGPTTTPTGRLFPHHVRHWKHFADQQKELWNDYMAHKRIWTEKTYTSRTRLDYLRSLIEPIGSEDELRHLEKLLVEDMVKQIFKEIDRSSELPGHLRTGGAISFENQARFRNAEERGEEAMERLSLHADTSARRRNTRADQFCVLRNKDGIARPVVAIEYKPPHKLTVEEISVGLCDEIDIRNDIVGQELDSKEFRFKRLIAAVLTQLFSYMIDKRVRYGYVCTGQAYVFVYIPKDPTVVYCDVSVPTEDYNAEDEDRIRHTAVWQVFAFIRQALQDDLPDQAWVDQAQENLSTWKVEFYDMLLTIPETERKSQEFSEYRLARSRWDTQKRRVLPRRAGGGGAAAFRRDQHDFDEDEHDEATSPSTQVSLRTRARTHERGKTSDRRGARGAGPDAATENRRQAIEQRPYCTHECLLGLLGGSTIDPTCPNSADHGASHPSLTRVLHMIKEQLASDRGSDADCCALWIHGARGALLKIRVSAYGYTMVAKGVETCSFGFLQHEEQIYRRLRTLQGHFVPVCLGTMQPVLPYHYDGSQLTHLLLLSWAGQSLAAMTRTRLDPQKYEQCWKLAGEALMAVHRGGILHRDAEARNMLFDFRTQKVMIVDFERSTQRTALAEISPNRKRKRNFGDKSKRDARFEREIDVAERSLRIALGISGDSPPAAR